MIYRVFWKNMAMDSAETRYAHLLQPLRDLTKNWDIDLASQLGEYLEEVRKHTEIKHRLSDSNVPFLSQSLILLLWLTAGPDDHII